MSESKENSFQDSWRKPAKSIKLVVKKRVRKTDDKSSRILKTRSANTEQEAQTAGQLKRHNPFGCSASKKSNFERSLSNDENVKLFSALDQPISRNISKEKTSSFSATLNEESINANISQEGSHSLCKSIDGSSEDDDKVSLRHLSGKKLPSDWSLKTRVCFTSSHPFNWCSKMLGKQEAQGLCNFVHCEVPHSEDNSTCFQQNIMYWIHPTLPWISLFPRLSSDIKLTSKVPNIAENQDITNALQASWWQSFRSLFNLLRCGYCEYFYLCSAQFTVMFRATVTGGLSSTSAYVTPTTKGIREGFDKEGISYILPVLDLTKDTSNDESDDEFAENDPSKNYDDDDACWLESMGVGKEMLPQLQQSKINQQRVKLRNIDHQSSSLAIITGSHTQALFNYLLNCKTLISKTGSHAGIPPTLLAPVAFDGATLQSLTAKHGMIKQGKNLKQKYSLDISGPILPGTLTKLCQLFESTQQHHFSAVMKNLKATAPFNVLSPEMQVEEQFNDENVLAQPSNLGTTSLTFIKYEDALYSWETS